MSPHHTAPIFRIKHGHQTGFTLIECMFAMFLMALVLPAVNLGIAAATHTADLARHRTEASGLAQSKLSELITSAQTQQLQSSGGDFGSDWPNYSWKSNVQNWAGGNQTTNTQTTVMQQLDVSVSWSAKDSVTVSTLVYLRPEAGAQ